MYILLKHGHIKIPMTSADYDSAFLFFESNKQFWAWAMPQCSGILRPFNYSGMIICPNFIEQICKHWSNGCEQNKPLDILTLDFFGQHWSSQKVLLNSGLMDKNLGLSREMEDEKGMTVNRLIRLYKPPGYYLFMSLLNKRLNFCVYIGLIITVFSFSFQFPFSS